MTFNLIDADDAAIPVIGLADNDALRRWLVDQPAKTANWVAATGFRAKAGTVCLLADHDGRLEQVLAGLGDEATDLWSISALRSALPDGDYQLADDLDERKAERAALGWALAGYRFDAYRGDADEKDGPRLVWPDGCDRDSVLAAARATFLVRDLINTPACDMGPKQLAEAAQDLAEDYDADCRVIEGDDLLTENFPAIHAVGRASVNAPRLIDLQWGDATHPRVTLVGKGVCFDSGGLDLKAASGMKLMKKDMGGGAHVLGLALMVMAAALPVRLRVLIPAVENSVAGNAFRPLDVLTMRSGKTVEIGNTDAEGRLVLADALSAASEEKPDLLIDIATLTGAARVALGPDLPALMSNDDGFANELLEKGGTENDPLWRLPLWKPYEKMIEGKVADLTNAAEGGFVGAITAGLFLEAFVGDGTPWAHIDVMAWNPTSRPGRPEGGEALSMRALFACLESRFGPQ